MSSPTTKDPIRNKLIVALKRSYDECREVPTARLMMEAEARGISPLSAEERAKLAASVMPATGWDKSAHAAVVSRALSGEATGVPNAWVK